MFTIKKGQMLEKPDQKVSLQNTNEWKVRLFTLFTVYGGLMYNLGEINMVIYSR